MRLFLLEAHSRHAALKSKSSKQGPSIEINSTCTVILLLRRFLRGVFILFSAEKPLSQSAVEAEISWAMAAKLQTFGNTDKRFFLHNCSHHFLCPWFGMAKNLHFEVAQPLESDWNYFCKVVNQRSYSVLAFFKPPT